MTDGLLFDFNADGSTVPRDLPYFPDPRDDNQRLLNYQHDWLLNRDEDAKAKLWVLAEKVALRMIRAQEQRHGFRLDPDRRRDKAMDALVYVFRRYSGGWYVTGAFLKAIKCGVIHALYYRTKAGELEMMVEDEVISRLITGEHGEEQLVYIDGMTRREAEARIRAELLPEIADRLLEEIRIIGGSKMKWWYAEEEERGTRTCGSCGNKTELEDGTWACDTEGYPVDCTPPNDRACGRYIEKKEIDMNWNYVSEGKLPERQELGVSDRVIVAEAGNDSVRIGYYDFEQGEWFVDGCRYPVNVYAWLDIEPPVEEV